MTLRLTPRRLTSPTLAHEVTSPSSRCGISPASRRRAHVALISTISILGLAVGVAALVDLARAPSGFQDRIRAQMAIRSPHVVCRRRGATGWPDPELARRALAALPGVLRSRRVARGPGLAVHGLRPHAASRSATETSPRVPAARRRRVPPARVSARGPLRALRANRDSHPARRFVAYGSRPIGPIPIAALAACSDIRRGSGAGEGRRMSRSPRRPRGC